MPQLRLGTFEWATADGVGVFAMGCPAISHRDGATHAPTTRCYSIQPLSYVVAASRANARPVGEINRVLNAMQADGTLDQLAAKWFVANAR